MGWISGDDSAAGEYVGGHHETEEERQVREWREAMRHAELERLNREGQYLLIDGFCYPVMLSDVMTNSVDVELPYREKGQTAVSTCYSIPAKVKFQYAYLDRDEPFYKQHISVARFSPDDPWIDSDEYIAKLRTQLGMKPYDRRVRNEEVAFSLLNEGMLVYRK